MVWACHNFVRPPANGRYDQEPGWAERSYLGVRAESRVRKLPPFCKKALGYQNPGNRQAQAATQSGKARLWDAFHDLPIHGHPSRIARKLP